MSVKIACPTTFTINDTKNNRKLLYILLRLLKNENQQNIVTFRQISALFDLKSRQDSNNFYRDFQDSDGDFLHFLQRKKKLGEAFPLIEKQVLKNPLIAISEHFRMFIENHPELKMSYQCFCDYVSEIDAIKLKKRFKELTTNGEIKPDSERFLKEIIEDGNTSKAHRKAIIETFPHLQQSEKEVKKEVDFLRNINVLGKNILMNHLEEDGNN